MKSLAYHYYLTGKESGVDGAVKRAQKDIADRYNPTSILGNQVLIPTQYTAKNVQDYAQRAIAQVPAFPFTNFTGTQFGQLSSQDAQEQDWRSIMAGHWVMSDDRQGLVWVDQQGLLRTDKNGKPLFIDFKDAETNSAKTPSLLDFSDEVVRKYGLGNTTLFDQLANHPLIHIARPTTNAEVQPSKQRETGIGGENFIKQTEQFRPVAYQDSKGNWTIGYGHTKGVKPGQRISEETANRFLKKDMREAESAIKDNVHVPLNQNQFDALVSFAFNVGGEAFKDSTLVKELNKGNYDAVRDELPRWTKTKGSEKGLRKRRQDEVNMFFSPIGK
jgi:lysozyme